MLEFFGLHYNTLKPFLILAFVILVLVALAQKALRSRSSRKRLNESIKRRSE